MKAKVARINLSNQTVDIFSSEQYFKLLGGRGYGVQVILNEVSPETDPLHIDNKLVFATGSLTGTALPGSSRTELVTKNVLNHGISFSSGGGNFGPALKSAGFDALIIEGKASKPVYLNISTGVIKMLPADYLWGKTTWECVDQIRAQTNCAETEVASIGPAGENLVKMSCVMIDKAHALAWGGSGAVMGSKNLKAIAVGCDGSIVEASDPDRFEFLAKKYSWALKASGASNALREGGTHGMAGVGGWSGTVPTAVKNLREEYWDPAKSKRISENAYRPFETGRTNCYNCPLYCLHSYKMEHEGDYLICEGMHANSVRGFGSNWDVDQPYAVLKAHALCNMYGLDVDGVSSVIAWAVECSEKGILSPWLTDGQKLYWGDYKSLLPLIDSIAYRSGFGDLLAEGVYRAGKEFGSEALKYAMHVKQVGLNEQGVRSHKAWAFGMAVSARGGGHLSGSPQLENRQIPQHTTQWLFGINNAGQPAVYSGKGRLVAWYEIYKALVDSLGMCYFTAGWYEVALADINIFVEAYNAFLGVSITSEELWFRGRYIVNMEKAFNTAHAGFARADDTLPSRILSEPLSAGPYKGEYFDPVELENMLNEYYSAHGWDPETGLQLPGKLLEEGFDEVANYLLKNSLPK